LKWSLSDLNYKPGRIRLNRWISGVYHRKPENIRLFNRDNTCELFFDFNTAVDYDIERKEDTLLIHSTMLAVQ
jgi:hypothetical protein